MLSELRAPAGITGKEREHASAARGGRDAAPTHAHAGMSSSAATTMLASTCGAPAAVGSRAPAPNTISAAVSHAAAAPLPSHHHHRSDAAALLSASYPHDVASIAPNASDRDVDSFLAERVGCKNLPGMAELVRYGMVTPGKVTFAVGAIEVETTVNEDGEPVGSLEARTLRLAAAISSPEEV